MPAPTSAGNLLAHRHQRLCSLRARESAPLAQSAERLHGKEKVYGSIP